MSWLTVGLFMIGVGWAAWSYGLLWDAVWNDRGVFRMALWALSGACGFWFTVAVALST